MTEILPRCPICGRPRFFVTQPCMACSELQVHAALADEIVLSALARFRRNWLRVVLATWTIVLTGNGPYMYLTFFGGGTLTLIAFGELTSGRMFNWVAFVGVSFLFAVVAAWLGTAAVRVADRLLRLTRWLASLSGQEPEPDPVSTENPWIGQGSPAALMRLLMVLASVGLVTAILIASAFPATDGLARHVTVWILIVWLTALQTCFGMSVFILADRRCTVLEALYDSLRLTRANPSTVLLTGPVFLALSLIAGLVLAGLALPISIPFWLFLQCVTYLRITGEESAHLE